MAESDSTLSGVNSKGQRCIRGPRKLHKAPATMENTTPYVIIKKRPPRRPKLENGSEIPISSLNQGREKKETISQNNEEKIIGNVKRILPKDEIDHAIRKIEDQFSSLELKKESSSTDTAERIISIPGKTSNENSLKKIRKRSRKRSRNKMEMVDYKNIEMNIGEANDIEFPKQSTSSFQYTNDIEKKERDYKNNHEECVKYLDKKTCRNESEENEVRKYGEKCNNVFKNHQTLKDKKRGETNNTEISKPGTSSYQYTNDVEKKEDKDYKRDRKECRWTKYLHKRLYRNQSEENEVRRYSEKCNNFSKNQQTLKEKKKRGKKTFCEHLYVEVAKKILAAQDPENPNIVEGFIRINPRCFQNAYISLPNEEQDILIVGLKNRNRALEGDLVAVVINPQDEWFKLTENTFQRTGAVVSILEKFHPRKAVGLLEKQDVFVFLHPRDTRVPILKINPKTVPRNFYDNPDLFKDILFLCNIVDWKKVAFAEGEIEEIIGHTGDLSIETNAILLENDLVVTPYADELLIDLPSADFIPSQLDFEDREDLRNWCIFTIDPATAVDLDDAVSCQMLDNGNFEVGVHIADVTHFLKAFSPLDEEVAKRATTVYMVDNVYHMLPKQLCLACSLLPGQDKLAFSVILEMTPTADIINYRFSKSVINSCCQMSYEQAQIIIENESYDWKKTNILKISGNYTSNDLVHVVQNLYKLSTQLSQKRFEEGALRIDQPKLSVFLDKETRQPISYKLDERKESNSLIEEFMLLANTTVAKYLYNTLPEVSMLRCHKEPKRRILQKTQNLLTKFGVVLDITTSKSLYSSLLLYQSNDKYPGDSYNVAQCRMMAINSLCAKSMLRAEYICSSCVKVKEDLKHYALSVDFYTHFTSPIRRYPDCVVHRLLNACINNQPISPNWTASLCAKMAKNCNTKKYSAKMAQEQSNTLYFTYMLDQRGLMNSFAIVMEVKERLVDAMLCDTGLKIRLYFSDTIEETKIKFTVEDDIPIAQLTWVQRKIDQVVSIFSILPVQITKHPQLFRLRGIILPPVQIDAN